MFTESMCYLISTQQRAIPGIMKFLLIVLCLHLQHTAETTPFVHQIKRFVDLFKSQVVGDVFIDLDFLLYEQIDFSKYKFHQGKAKLVHGVGFEN